MPRLFAPMETKWSGGPTATDRDDDRTKKPDRNAAVTLAPAAAAAAAAADSKFRPMFIHPPINISIRILKREHVAGV